MQLCKFLTCTMDWKLYIAKLLIAVETILIFFFFNSILESCGEGERKKDSVRSSSVALG